MRYRTFAATGDEISILGFGAMGMAGWFGEIDDGDAIRALHAAFDLGVNMVDSARAYERSEDVVGKGLRSWSGAQPFVASKIQPLGPRHQWAIPPAVEEVFPKGWVTESCETSLRHLRRDHVDLMQLHLYWPTWGHDGYWMDELQALKQAGKARSVGVSVPDHRHDMVISLVESGLIDSVQTIVNVFDSEALDVLVPICQQHGVAVIARCILDEGGLTGSLTTEVEFPDGDFRHGYFDWTVPRPAYIAKVDALRQYVPAHATSLAALAVKFAVHHPGVTTGISSMHIEDHARANAAAIDDTPLRGDVAFRLMTSHRFAVNLGHSGHWDIAAAEAMT